MILIFLIFLFQIICKVKSALDAKSEQHYLVNDQLLHKYLVVFLGQRFTYIHLTLQMVFNRSKLDEIKVSKAKP